MYGWHITRLDGTTEFLKVCEEVGVTNRISNSNPIKVAFNGFHGCQNIYSLLTQAQGPLVKFCKFTGTIDTLEELFCASERTVLWQVDASSLLREWSYYCVDHYWRSCIVSSLNDKNYLNSSLDVINHPTVVDLPTLNSFENLLIQINRDTVRHNLGDFPLLTLIQKSIGACKSCRMCQEDHTQVYDNPARLAGWTAYKVTDDITLGRDLQERLISLVTNQFRIL